MKVRSEQLDSHLQSDLAPVYIVSGDEPLLVQEAADAIRSAARRQDYATRDLLHVERSFDWHSLLDSADTLSLFAERRIIELRMPTGKPGKEGGKTLTATSCPSLPRKSNRQPRVAHTPFTVALASRASDSKPL